ncbi:hypothetical protein ACSFA8_10475 [Variovorax sp. RT4R15]|uniref:hypothetical protein n=1 Tax=Variovorax sp. RT4R15 TaxID=3443737 RepID=UPI003F470E09
MTEPAKLSDRELVRRAQQWRRQSLYGARNASDHAREHEAEMRRRFGGSSTLAAPLVTLKLPLARRPRPWWRVW